MTGRKGGDRNNDDDTKVKDKCTCKTEREKNPMIKCYNKGNATTKRKQKEANREARGGRSEGRPSTRSARPAQRLSTSSSPAEVACRPRRRAARWCRLSRAKVVGRRWAGGRRVIISNYHLARRTCQLHLCGPAGPSAAFCHLSAFQGRRPGGEALHTHAPEIPARAATPGRRDGPRGGARTNRGRSGGRDKASEHTHAITGDREQHGRK